MGLATSFYNSRDSDLGETLTKTLLETHQIVPDFLEEHIPEGFSADGATGDVNTLKFDADSDDGQGEENAEPGEDNGGATTVWSTEAAPAWGGAAAETEVPAATVWNATTSAPAPVVAAPAPLTVPWNAPAPVAQPTPAVAWGGNSGGGW